MFDQGKAREVVSMLFSKYDFNKSETLEGEQLGGFFNESFSILRLPITVTKDEISNALKTCKGTATKQDLFNALSLIYMNRKRNAFQPPQPISQDPKFQMGLQTGFVMGQGLNPTQLMQPQQSMQPPAFLGIPQSPPIGVPQNHQPQKMHSTGYPIQQQQIPQQQFQNQYGTQQPPLQMPTQYQQPPQHPKQQFGNPQLLQHSAQHMRQSHPNSQAPQQPQQTPYLNPGQFQQQAPSYPLQQQYHQPHQNQNFTQPQLQINQPPQYQPMPQGAQGQKQAISDYELDNKIRNYVNLLYQKYDVDNSGGLDVQELGNVFNEIMAELNIPTTFTIPQSMNLIKKIDKNKNGRIEKFELYTCLRNLVDGKKMDA